MNRSPDGSMALVPSRIEGVVEEIIDGELLLYHPQQSKALYLNPTAGMIWGLCDGRRAVRDIVELIEQGYEGVEAEALTKDILAALTELQESGVLVVG